MGFQAWTLETVKRERFKYELNNTNMKTKITTLSMAILLMAGMNSSRKAKRKVNLRQ